MELDSSELKTGQLQLRLQTSKRTSLVRLSATSSFDQLENARTLEDSQIDREQLDNTRALQRRRVNREQLENDRAVQDRRVHREQQSRAAEASPVKADVLHRLVNLKSDLVSLCNARACKPPQNGPGIRKVDSTTTGAHNSVATFTSQNIEVKDFEHLPASVHRRALVLLEQWDCGVYIWGLVRFQFTA